MGNLLDALHRLQCGSPELDTETLTLSELLHISDGKSPQPTSTAPRLELPQFHAINYHDQEGDGDDEYEDEREEAPQQPATHLLPPHFSKPLPTRPKQGNQYLYNPPHDVRPTDLTALRKGSDGIRDARHSAGANYNSIFGGPQLTDVQRHIEETIPAHTLTQRKLLKQKKPGKSSSKRQARLESTTSKRHASPRTPSSKGSPFTPNEEQKSPSPRPYTPFPKKFALTRAHSESPQRSRTRLHKQEARMSAPMLIPHALNQPTTAFNLDTDSGAERGRTRLRKDKQPFREKSHRRLRGGKEGLAISKPTLQHPVLLPTMSLGTASHLVSPGLHNDVRTPSPLVKEQKVSSAEEGSTADARDG